MKPDVFLILFFLFSVVYVKEMYYAREQWKIEVISSASLIYTFIIVGMVRGLCGAAQKYYYLDFILLIPLSVAMHFISRNAKTLAKCMIKKSIYQPVIEDRNIKEKTNIKTPDIFLSKNFTISRNGISFYAIVCVYVLNIIAFCLQGLESPILDGIFSCALLSVVVILFITREPAYFANGAYIYNSAQILKNIIFLGMTERKKRIKLNTEMINRIVIRDVYRDNCFGTHTVRVYEFHSKTNKKTWLSRRRLDNKSLLRYDIENRELFEEYFKEHNIEIFYQSQGIVVCQCHLTNEL